MYQCTYVPMEQPDFELEFNLEPFYVTMEQPNFEQKFHSELT